MEKSSKGFFRILLAHNQNIHFLAGSLGSSRGFRRKTLHATGKKQEVRFSCRTGESVGKVYNEESLLRK